MSYLERYKKGEHIKVYDEIAALGVSAFEEEHFQDVFGVMVETFNRVAFNLNAIFMELIEVGYNFNSAPEYDYQRAVLSPLPDIPTLLPELMEKAIPLGHVPLSLQLFYQIAGSCNFSWNYNTQAENPWKGADPIQIYPLNYLLESINGLENGNGNLKGLKLGADYLTKDNLGETVGSYQLLLTPEPAIDSELAGVSNNTTFVNYLRSSFKNGGFSRAEDIQNVESFQYYFNRVKRKLWPI